ncbi:ABC transporter substrate-binding protein [Asanoa sp. WMMD1127]|uniref:ABC transporter substrate-binding protein n=1 Tax=Asanoa sp. WMMD1127 TaxID=3016107 RepID=UPI002416033A|nr:ABC transporter substrate-binding protein [Asanoa sp. WMMD1127]MDG4821003.1 ABC transporter substrate-binding protein [Asanoa sp. WMMD1127]
MSLLPAATEIVHALGLADDLVGVTFECEVTAPARPAVIVGGRDTKGMTPAEIDAYVRSTPPGDLYTLHADALADLEPDLILTQDLCRVCALPSGRVADALDHLGCRADVLTLDPHTLAEVLDSIQSVGERAGAPAVAAALVASLRGRLSAVAAAVSGLRRPRVALIEWIDPPFGAGHWIPDLIAAAGGAPVAAHPGARSTATTWPAIQTAAPDVVVVAPCGYDLPGAADQARTIAEHFRDVPIWAIDADALIVRPGPRLIDGVEALAAILHPTAAPTPPPNRITRVA